MESGSGLCWIEPALHQNRWIIQVHRWIETVVAAIVVNHNESGSVSPFRGWTERTTAPRARAHAFDQSSNVKWGLDGYSPVMLTSDGGLIAQATSGQFTTFDQNGVAIGHCSGTFFAVPSTADSNGQPRPGGLPH